MSANLAVTGWVPACRGVPADSCMWLAGSPSAGVYLQTLDCDLLGPGKQGCTCRLLAVTGWVPACRGAPADSWLWLAGSPPAGLHRETGNIGTNMEASKSFLCRSKFKHIINIQRGCNKRFFLTSFNEFFAKIKAHKVRILQLCRSCGLIPAMYREKVNFTLHFGVGWRYCGLR